MEGTKQNPVVPVIKVLAGIILAAGFITLIYWTGSEEAELLGGLATATALNSFFTCLVASAVLYGFAEVIRLLDGIHRQLVPEVSVSKEAENKDALILDPVDREVSEEVKTEILRFYERKENQVLNVHPTPIDGVYQVELEDRTEYIDTNGFSPEVLTQDEVKKYPKLS